MAAISPERRTRAQRAILAYLREHEAVTVKQLAEALGPVDDVEVLLDALLDARVYVSTPPDREWGPEPTEREVEDARRAGETAVRAAMSDVLRNALSRDQAASLLGISPQAVSDRRSAGRLLGLRRGREWRFPAWQFLDGDTVPGLEALLAEWPGTALSLCTWAVKPSVDLDGRTPVHVLGRRNGPERVLDVVRSLSTAAW